MTSTLHSVEIQKSTAVSLPPSALPVLDNTITQPHQKERERESDKKAPTINTPPPVYTSGCVRTGPLWLQTIMTLTISISLAQQAASGSLSHRLSSTQCISRRGFNEPRKATASLRFQRPGGANPSCRPPTRSVFTGPPFASCLILESKTEQLPFFSRNKVRKRLLLPAWFAPKMGINSQRNGNPAAAQRFGCDGLFKVAVDNVPSLSPPPAL